MGPTIRTVDLVRSWLGQALRATGAAVVVPVAILVALSLTAIGGSGLGGLGALSQIVSGPRAAGSDVTVDDGDTEIAAAVTQLAAGGTDGAVTAPTTGTGGGPDDRPWRRWRSAGRQRCPVPAAATARGGDGIEPTPPGGGEPAPTPAPPRPAPARPSRASSTTSARPSRT